MREGNKLVDALANQALDEGTVNKYDTPSVDTRVWMTSILVS